MMTLIILICLLILAFISYKITKDIISPPCILSISWALPFLFLVITESFKPNSFDIDVVSFYYVIGVFIFIIGYLFANNKKYKNIKNIKFDENKKLSFIFKTFIIIELLVVLYFLKDVSSFVNLHYKYNFWFTYKWNVSMGNYSDPIIIEYLRTASRIILCIMFINVLSKNYVKSDRKWFLIQTIITLILNFISQGRGAIFNLFIPLFIIYIMMRRNSTKSILRISLIGFTTLILIFIIYDSMKNPYLDSTKDNVFISIENYLCGSIIAFTNWINSSHEHYYGLYTFRFLFALLKPLGFNVNVVSMVEEYTPNINGNIGNVYTFYKWYANDFGLIYALFWQLIIGILHGVITKKMYLYHNNLTLVIYSLSFYPLIMQFFMDEYITMLSTWIQTFFWIFLILKTNIFYVNLKGGNENDINNKNDIKKNKKEYNFVK